ncbi:MAG: hypothetical protein HY943_23830 [Gammaproteobacteria bacterium]|nr:hypothetical protein [Gammaproteobacteria bacterium]
MTYCLGIALENGLVFCSDSRTNAGVDQVSTYSKMHLFKTAEDRQFVLLSSGNLATTQAVVMKLKQDLQIDAPFNLNTARTVDEAAEYIGEVSLKRQAKHTEAGQSSFDPKVTFIFGGQIRGAEPMLFLVYPEGNYITTSVDTPYLQIGESKYGKPILDRVIKPGTSIEDAAKCAIVSMDSTIRSNLSVGPPIELRVYEKDTFEPGRYLRFLEDDPYLRQVSRTWNQKLIEAYRTLPEISWGYQG